MASYTLVLSGAAYNRAKVGASLRQVGADVEQGNLDSHGFDVKAEESFITCHDFEIDRAIRAAEPFGWSLRSHWVRTGAWARVGKLTVPDPLVELEKLKSQLRANGINLK